MNDIERAQLKSRLLGSNPSVLQAVCHCYGLQCNMDQPEEIADTLLLAVDEGKIDRIALVRIANFTKEYGDIFVSLGKMQLMELLCVPKSKYKSMKLDELKKSFLGKVAEGELELASLAIPLKKEAIKKALKPLETDQSLLGILVSTIQGVEILMSTLDDTISVVDSAIQKGRLNLTDLTNLVKKIKKDRESTVRGRELQLLRGDLKEVKKTLERIEENLAKGVRWNPSPELLKEFPSRLHHLRLAQSRVGDFSEKRIDALLMEIQKEGLSRERLFEMAMIITSIHELDEYLSKLRFSFPAEDFYRALEEVAEQQKTFTHLVIRDIAKALEQKLGLTREEFFRQLAEVADKEWVRFIDGAPLNHTQDDWFDYKNRKYYYMKLDKSSNR